MKVLVGVLMFASLCSASSQWEAIGPWGGGLNGLTVYPPNEDIAYAATYSENWDYAPSPSSVFKSLDGGVTWTFVGSTPNIAYEILVDPSSSSTIYGGGRYDMYVDTFYASLDGGQTWTKQSISSDSGYFFDLAIHPLSPSILYAAGTVRADSPLYSLMTLFKSSDAGQSWEKKKFGPARSEGVCVALDPSNPSTMYVGGYCDVPSRYAKVYRSTDGGANFIDVSSGLPASVEIKCLTVHPTNPNIIYAAAGYYYGMYRSTDSGGSWSLVFADVDVRSFATTPADPAVVYAAGYKQSELKNKIYKSTDAGASWFEPDSDFVSLCNILYAKTSNASHVYVTSNTRYGFYQTDNGGTDWSASNHGINCLWIPCVAACPSSPGLMYTSAFDGGVLKTSNSGNDWTRESELQNVTGYGFSAMALHNSNHNIAFGMTGYG